jgi:D-alanine--poly(phosphoribitol) ligase subunit 1
VRGSGVALGYWNDPDKTKAAFVPNPLRVEVRETIYRTGDIVRRQDGLLYFVGRRDQQIKHNGYRIELGEIEAVASAIEAVEACVAGYDAQGRQIWLAVKAAAGLDAGIDRVGLLKRLAVGLPKYMLPTKIEFLSALPYTANGKFDRQALSRLLCA